MKLVKIYPTKRPIEIKVNGKISPIQLIELSSLGWKIQKQAI